MNSNVMKRCATPLIAAALAAAGLGVAVPAAAAAVLAPAAAAPAPLRVMPLGDSITWGVGSPSGNSAYC